MSVKTIDNIQHVTPSALDNHRYETRIAGKIIKTFLCTANTWYRVCTLVDTNAVGFTARDWRGIHYFQTYRSVVNFYSFSGDVGSNNFTNVPLQIALYKQSDTQSAVYIKRTENSEITFEFMNFNNQANATCNVNIVQQNPSGTALWTNYSQSAPPSSNPFHTQYVNATAFRANWADIAEYYEADVPYAPGTLVQFGGKKEITIAHDSVFSVVSTDPSYIMNAQISNKQTALKDAVLGRVPVRVKGIIKRHEKIYLSNTDGIAWGEHNLNFVSNTEKLLARSLLVGTSLEKSDEVGEKLIICSINANQF